MTALPPLVYTDETHQEAPIIIATAILLFTALLFVGARVLVRSTLEGSSTDRFAGSHVSLLGVDDLLLVAATALYVLQSVLVWAANSSGLGVSIHLLSAKDAGRAQKLYYASTIFLVGSLGCAKASVSYLIIRINSSRSHTITRAMKGVLGLVATWTIALVFLFIFACGTETPWGLTGEQCPHWFSKWIVLGVGESFFEAAFVFTSLWNVWALQTHWSNKVAVVALFAMRLPIIPILAVQLGIVDRDAFSADPTLHVKLFVCFSQLALSYSICAANFPAFRRLTSDIRTDFGGFGTVGSTRVIRSAYLGSGKSARSGNAQECDTIPMTTGSGKQKDRRDTLRGPALQGIDTAGYSVEARHCDTMSLSSNAASEHESEDMIIRTRTEVIVRHDNGTVAEY
ncbi:hypothetical protein LTS12_000282 [Elasticomyces elasticus]|nr:hypothetical protein LTS12_000282 [Elasticomyces elasticus]